MDAYTNIVLSYDFARVVAFEEAGHNEFGFMWPADLTDKEVAIRVQERNSRVINAELDRWTWMDNRLGKGGKTQAMTKG